MEKFDEIREVRDGARRLKAQRDVMSLQHLRLIEERGLDDLGDFVCYRIARFGVSVAEMEMSLLSRLRWWRRLRHSCCIVGTSSHIARLHLSRNHHDVWIQNLNLNARGCLSPEKGVAVAAEGTFFFFFMLQLQCGISTTSWSSMHCGARTRNGEIYSRRMVWVG